MLDRARVRALRAEGAGVREIARMLDVSRGAVRRALDPDAPLTYRRGEAALDEVEPAVRAVLTEYPLMPTSRVAEHVGWAGSTRHLARLVRDLRAELLPTSASIAGGARARAGRARVDVVTTGRASAVRIAMGRTTWPRS